MHFVTLQIVLLAICCPLLVHTKMVVVMPRPSARRSVPHRHPPPGQIGPAAAGGHPGPPVFTKHGTPVGFPFNYPGKKLKYSGPTYPRGGDDFDLGHEYINNVKIPHGKGYSHALSYGKGYIPYDNLKGPFVPSPMDKYRGESSIRNQQYDFSFSPSTSLGSFNHPQKNPQLTADGVDSYFSDIHQDFGQKTSGSEKVYSSRSVGKNHHQQKSFKPLPSSINDIQNTESTIAQLKAKLIKSLTELGATQHQLASSNAAAISTNGLQNNFATLQSSLQVQTPSGANYQPLTTNNQQQLASQNSQLIPGIQVGNLQTTSLGNNKRGIVFSDSLNLDEYQKKMEEFANSWSKIGGGSIQGFPVNRSAAPVAQAWTRNQDGYAVKEDSSKTETSQFKPILGNHPVQGLLVNPLTINNQLPALSLIQG